MQTFYLDSNSYDRPLNPFIETQLYWKLVPGLWKKRRITLKRNIFTSNDDPFSIKSESYNEFYSVANIISDDQFESDGTLLSLQIMLASEQIKTKRSVYSLSEMLSSVGGFSEIVIFIANF